MNWRAFVETWEAELDQRESELAVLTERARERKNEWVFEGERKRVAEDRACIAEIREKILGRSSQAGLNPKEVNG